MDIEYLLLLQRFRESIHNALTPFMESVSLFAVTYLIMIPVFVYWAVDKRKGLYTLVSYFLCCGFNAMLKLTACIYRPWIRDARIMPAGGSHYHGDRVFFSQRAYGYCRMSLRLPLWIIRCFQKERMKADYFTKSKYGRAFPFRQCLSVTNEKSEPMGCSIGPGGQPTAPSYASGMLWNGYIQKGVRSCPTQD